MRAIYTANFNKDAGGFPEEVLKKLEKQIYFLLRNLRHPSLHTKKYDEARDIWQARVDDNIRFYFKIKSDTCVLLNVKKHPK